MFVLYFISAIFILTFTHNILFFVLGFCFISILLVIFRFSYNIGFLRNFGFLILAFLLAFVSAGIRDCFFYHDYVDPGKALVGSGYISDIISQDKYVFHDFNDNKYILHASGLSVGDVILTDSKVYYSFTGFGFSRDFQVSLPDFYTGYLFMKGYHGILYDQNHILLDHKSLGFISEFKDSFISKVEHTYGESETSAILLAMTIGDKSMLSQQIYQDFIDSSLVHILVVSGSNLALVIIFISIILFFVPFYLRLGFMLVGLVFYALVCGMDTSIFRALIMSGLIILALFAGRKIDTWRAIGIAVFIMLIYNPYYLIYDLGFLLSFGAVAGIQVFSRYTWSNKTLDRYIKPMIGVQIGILPIIILYVGKIGLLGILANILVLPIVGVALIFGFISVFAYGLFGREIILLPFKYFIIYIMYVAQNFATYNIYINIENIWVRVYIFIALILTIVYLYLGRLDKES